MNLTMMKSKIHRARVTQCELDYEGSVTIDSDLMKQANIKHNEQVHIFNNNNGHRTITYAIEGEPGSRIICINGPGARLAEVNDIIVICAYASIDESEADTFQPHILFMDENNEVKDSKRR